MKIDGWVNRTVEFEFVWTSRNLQSRIRKFETQIRKSLEL